MRRPPVNAAHPHSSLLRGRRWRRGKTADETRDLHLAGAQAAVAADDAIDKDSTGGEQLRHGLDSPPRHLEDFVLYNASQSDARGHYPAAGRLMACSKHPDKYLGPTRSAAERSLPEVQHTYFKDDELRRRQTRSPPPTRNIVPHMHRLELMFTDLYSCTSSTSRR
jgi:hypothetical protein